MKTLQQKYIYGLDGLRALAVIMVIGYHLRIPIFRGGVLGVTIFFVISGFLITRLLLQELQSTNNIDLKTFWVKRIKRIWPALILMISVVIIVFAIFNRVLFTKAASDYVSALLGYNNWYQIFNNISYFDNGGAASPLLHCWSLAIETQFYLVFPFIILILSRLKRSNKERTKLFLIVTGALTVISAFLMFIIFDPEVDPTRVYYGLDTRSFSLLIGALLAIITSYNPKVRLNKVVNNIVGIVSLIGICYMVVNVAGYDEVLYRGGYLLASLLAALVILSILRPMSFLSQLLSLSVFDWIGKLSYSIYLWHYPVIILISGGKPSPWYIMILEVVLTFVLATLSYYLVETPIRHGVISKSIKALKNGTMYRQRALQRDFKIILVAIFLFISSVGCVAFVPKQSVTEAITTEDETEKEDSDETKDEDTSTTDETKKEETTTTVSDEDITNNLDVLLIGDSVSEMATANMQAIFPKIRINAKVSRHCSDSIPVLTSEMNDAGWNGDALIWSLGTNGPVYEFMPKTRELLPADKIMFVLTIRSPYDEWTEDNNAKIKAFCEANENVYLIDWQTYSNAHEDWFVSDETHLTNAGMVGFAECVKQGIVDVYKTLNKTKETKTTDKTDTSSTDDEDEDKEKEESTD